MAEEAPDERVPCMGTNERLCLCNACLETKLRLLRDADVDLQRAILQHLPDFNVHPDGRPVRSDAGGRTEANHRVGSPPGFVSQGRPGSLENVFDMRRLISDHSLFTIPLWSIDGDAEVQPFPSTRYPNIHEEIVIPPSVEQYVSNIKECIDYVFDNAQYGPRKYSAMIESVQEILQMLEGRIRREAGR